MKCLPERGRIGIFNRSYYEEVLVVRVHPEILANERIPAPCHKEHLGRTISGYFALSNAILPATAL